MNKKISKQLKSLRVGDFLQIDWHDAYKGEIRIERDSMDLTQFEVPVSSWGIYLGIVGKKSKYVLLMRDRFNLNEFAGIDDIDHNGIPLGMIYSIRVLGHISLNEDFQSRLDIWLSKARIRRRKGRSTIPREDEMN